MPPSRARLARVVDDRRERAVVVEEERERPAGELAAEPGLEVLRATRADARGRAPRRARKSREPRVHVVLALAQLERAHAGAALDRSIDERLVQAVGDARRRCTGSRGAPRASSPRRRRASTASSTPGSSTCEATYSFATRFMPSRSGVTSATTGVAVEAGELVGRRPSGAGSGSASSARCRSGRSPRPTSSSTSRFRRWYSATSPRLGSAICSEHDAARGARGAARASARTRGSARGSPSCSRAGRRRARCARAPPRRAARRRLARAHLDLARSRCRAERRRPRRCAAPCSTRRARGRRAAPSSPLRAVEEVRRVARRVEADEVAREQPAQELAVPRQDAEDVVRRERNVEEEGDPRAGPSAAQRARPRASAGSRGSRPARRARRARPRARAKRAFTASYASHSFAVELHAGRERVEERPQRAVREAVVVELDLLRRERDRRELVARRRSGACRRAERPPGPAEPRAAVAGERRLERGHEAAARALDLGSVPALAHA